MSDGFVFTGKELAKRLVVHLNASQGNKIPAIKLLRGITELGLREAKELVDAALSERDREVRLRSELASAILNFVQLSPYMTERAVNRLLDVLKEEGVI